MAERGATLSMFAGPFVPRAVSNFMKPFSHVLAMVFIAAIITVTSVACRSQRAPAATLERSSGEPAAVIVISDSPPEFVPSTVTVKVGDAVEWRNTGAIAHSVDFLGPRAPASGEPSEVAVVIAPDDTYIRTFGAAGTYSYACRFHITNGMSGKIVVVANEHTTHPGP